MTCPPRRRRTAGVAALLLLASGLAATGLTVTATAVVPAADNSVCGTMPAPAPAITHVVWVVMENRSYGEVIRAPLTPYTTPGTRWTVPADHYSLLRATEQLLQLPFLGQAATAPSLTQAFGM